MRTGNCISCGKVLSYEPIVLMGIEVFSKRCCAACDERREREEKEQQARGERTRLNDRWKEICPETYRNTNAGDLRLNQTVLAAVLKWRPGERGLGLIGQSGAGKTRMMFLLLRDLHFGGMRVRYVRATRLAWLAAKMFDDEHGGAATNELLGLERAPVLFIDDLGKEKFSEKVAERLYDLVEARGDARPILWTSNHSSAELTAMMSTRGPAIMRRLKEFSRVIQVEKPDVAAQGARTQKRA